LIDLLAIRRLTDVHVLHYPSDPAGQGALHLFRASNSAPPVEAYKLGSEASPFQKIVLQAIHSLATFHVIRRRISDYFDLKWV